MMRIPMIAFMVIALLAAPLVAQEPPAGKVYRIGILGTIWSTWADQNWDVFRQALRDLGYVEGRNLIIDYRSAEGKVEKLPVLATELVKLNVDAIYAATTPGAVAARNATTTIPIVFAFVGDPIKAGLVTSLARPGRNITGTLSITPELMGKRVELLKEIMPNASLVAVLSNPDLPDTNARLHAETDSGREDSDRRSANARRNQSCVLGDSPPASSGTSGEPRCVVLPPAEPDRRSRGKAPAASHL
jgi:ABC-type uncharacterized transport system substrate-binding protein